MQSSKSRRVESGIKLLLAVAAPFQKFIDKPGYTHEFCNKQAVEILASDGYHDFAEFIKSYLPEINNGVYWADQGWKNINHYYVPTSGKGLWNCSNALEIMEVYYNKSLQGIREGQGKVSAFFLGATAHLLQDLCVPHHARARLFSGHKEFEYWAQQNCTLFPANQHGIYNYNLTIYDLARRNAEVAADFLSWVQHENDLTGYEKSIKVLLPLAQLSTAGLFLKYAQEVFQQREMKRKIILLRAI